VKGDDNNEARPVGIWLLALCALLLALILLGGATRLTESGLSIVDWQPVTGIMPPIGEAAWLREFEAYRQSPQYRLVNAGMSLADFRFIYWLEYGHRLLARGLGLAFVVPLILFWRRGLIGERLRRPLIVLLLLGAAQGYMGWFMVKSGLVDIPRVSTYGLAAHLGLALVIFSLMLRLAMDILWPARRRRSVPSALSLWSKALIAGVAATILAGAFVAGLRAGYVYNGFPLMGGRWIPEGLLGLEPLWRNFFENPATVQFVHRCLGLGTAILALAGPLAARRMTADRRTRLTIQAVAAVAVLQAGLGIATLVSYVPLALAVSHQGCAVVLLAAALAVHFLIHYQPATGAGRSAGGQLPAAAG